MKKVFMFAFSLLFFVAIATPYAMAENQSTAKSEDKASVQKAVDELFEVARLSQIGKKISAQLVRLQQRKMPDIPEQFWSDFSKEIDLKGLKDKIKQLYINHLTLKEMQEITAFYKTESGQTFLDKLPALSVETMKVGREWGMDLRLHITKRLQEVDLKAMKEKETKKK